VAGKWGRVAYWVRVPAWRADERGGDGWERSLQDLVHACSGSLSLSFLSKFRVKHRAGVMLGDGLLCWVGLDAKPRWKKF
jgi:hypothetical protein